MLLSLFNFIFSLLTLISAIMHDIYKYYLKKKDMLDFYKREKIINLLIVGLIVTSGTLLIVDALDNYTLKHTQGSIILINLSFFILIFLCLIVFNTLQIKSKFQIMLGPPSRWKSRGSIKLGKILDKGNQKHDFFLKIEDLAQHMFITGITGTGKSNFLQQFLLEFSRAHQQIPFLLTEFKGEYHYLQRDINNLLILKPGINFSINIFDPEGSNPQIHAERVYQIFESGGLLENVEYSPQMERIFVDILNSIIPLKQYRNWKKFDELSRRYLEEEHNNDIIIQKSVLAIQNRIRRYYIGPLKHVFDEKRGLNVKDLFNHKIILDLNSIIKLGGEKEDALFFLNMILKYMWDKNLEIGSRGYNGIRHLTIIEDAQYFAPQELSARTKLTSYIEDITLLLRGTGECLISLATRPNISKEILSNCGVFVAFQIHLQKDLLQEMLNLKEWQVKYLSELKRGQCLIRVNSIEKPFVLQIPLVERSWPADEEIEKNNKKVLMDKLDALERPTDDKFKKSDLQKSKSMSLTILSRDYEESITPISDKEIVYCKFCGTQIENKEMKCKECFSKLELEDYVKNLRKYERN